MKNEKCDGKCEGEIIMTVTTIFINIMILALTFGLGWMFYMLVKESSFSTLMRSGFMNS